MPPQDMLNDGYDDLVTKLQTITGLQVANDPRNINPPCLLVQAPSITMFNNVIANMQFAVTVIGTGPGNRNALTKLLEITDLVREKAIGLIEARPVVQQVGGAEFPAYELTINVKVSP